MNQLQDKVALVTGASSGIGRAVARLFAAEGAKLALAARSTDKLEALAREIGGNALVLSTDLSVPASADRMVADALAHFGRIDVLMANAGIFITGPAVEDDPDDWDAMLNVNVNSVFRAVRAVLPSMIDRRSGDIIVTSSIAGHQVLRDEPVYSASKHAVQTFVHSIRRQVAKDNVRVGAIAPGTVLNELWGYHDPKEIDRAAARHEGVRSEDVAEACLWMLTRPPNITIRDLVILPQGQDI